MAKKKVLTIDRVVWESMRQAPELAQIRKRNKGLIGLMKEESEETSDEEK